MENKNIPSVFLFFYFKEAAYNFDLFFNLKIIAYNFS